MYFGVGDLVTRKSYNNDLILEIIDVVDDTCYLRNFKKLFNSYNDGLTMYKVRLVLFDNTQ